jgi:hypothetical protein
MTANAVPTPSAANIRVYRPGSPLPLATFSGHPGGPPASPRSNRSWKDPEMPSTTKPKPQPAEDEREQARRALQTSMDTRQ